MARGTLRVQGNGGDPPPPPPIHTQSTRTDRQHMPHKLHFFRGSNCGQNNNSLVIDRPRAVEVPKAAKQEPKLPGAAMRKKVLHVLRMSGSQAVIKQETNGLSWAQIEDYDYKIETDWLAGSQH